MDAEIFNHKMQMVTSSMDAFRVGPLKVKVAHIHDAKLKIFTTQEHEHYFYEFCYMTESCCIYQVQGQKLFLDANDSSCALIPSTQSHLRKAPERYNVFSISTIAHLIIEPISPEYVTYISIFREMIYWHHFKFHRSSSFDALESQLRLIVEEEKPYWVEYASCKLKELILSFFFENFPNLSIHEDTLSVKKNQDTIGRFLFMISVWSHASVTAGFIAEKVGLSERQLARIVKAQFGMSLGEFITMKRMEHAKELLSSNAMLVKDAAVNLGFRDTSHFCRIFRKFFGITPKQYVRQQQIAARNLDR